MLAVVALHLAAIVLGPSLGTALRHGWLELVPVLAPLCGSGGDGGFGLALGGAMGAAMGGAWGGALWPAAIHAVHALTVLAAGSGAAAGLGLFAAKRLQRRVALSGDAAAVA